MSAEAELSYVNYDSRDNTRHTSANSLAQRYSVLYDKSGKFASGKLGKYDVALGYEWLTYDTDIKSSLAPQDNLRDSKGHIFYSGEILIDPKEIPFKLKIYSRDMKKSEFATDTSTALISSSYKISPFSTLAFPSASSGLNTPSNSRYVAVTPNLTTGIYNGKHIESGATLVMGVKNGMTNGYNEMLRHFPMLMLDYRDELNLDKDGPYPVDNRLTRLAFVSLNKKDNWFHYRYVTYDDNIDRNNNYRETQIQMGTVDQNLQRRWIDFSNWLSLSVDGQHTRREQARVADSFDEFSLNLFGTARRQSWEVAAFNNFTRYNEYNHDKITYKSSIPVYANGILSPTAIWSAYTKYNDSNTDKGEYFTTVGGGYSIDTFRKSKFTLSQGLGVEQTATSDNNESLVMSGNIGVTSTPLFSRDLSLKALYTIRNYRYNRTGKASTFTDQEVSGDVGYNLTNQLRVMLEQTNRFTSGESHYIASPVSGGETSNPQYQAPRGNISAGQTAYQSVTKLRVSWIPKPRLSIGLSLSEDIYVPASGAKSTVTRAETTLDYTDNRLKISSRNSYVSGNSYSWELANQFSSVNSASYIFNRSLDTRVGFSYFRTIGVANQTDLLNFEQALNYSYYNINGFNRKLFEINELFTSAEEASAISADLVTSSTTKQRVNTLLLGAKFYPLRQMMISAGTRYSFVNSFQNDMMYYYGTLSMQFKLLEASLDYTYGKSKADNRVEKRFMANVKKRF